MRHELRRDSGRENHTKNITTDLAITGGGLSGVCAAITAARAGVKVVLIQDRPVLGGNASSEVRLWALGATSHMGNNNRWSREGGVIDEILLENLWRNPLGNALLLDSILLEKVSCEENITLLLNTAVHAVSKKNERIIEEIEAFCSQNSTSYKIQAPLYCDCSGDGIIGFLAGAEFRMGAEASSEFGEKFAQEQANSELLGHTLYFYSKRVEKPVTYIPPAFALKDITQIPRYKIINEKDDGCRLWWIEYGGIRDTVFETEEIKWELWKIIYGVWDYIKNSGEFENVDDLTLEWVGTIPGKRESRRFAGLYMLKQQDIVEQKYFEDAVAHGGWAIDIHPAEGVYSKENYCTQWHSKGVYHIPYRCYVSKDIDNLFFAGRIISATHIAFGSTRVMLTCALGGQAVGMAAAVCLENSILPPQILDRHIPALQQRLNLKGQSIPLLPINTAGTLTDKAQIKASSTIQFDTIAFDGDWLALDKGVAQMLPLQKGEIYSFAVAAKASADTTLICELRLSDKKENYTPNIVHERVEIVLKQGEQDVEICFEKAFPQEQYGFLTFLKNDDVELRCSNKRFTGVLAVFNKFNKAVSNYGRQETTEDIGVDDFEFWTPERRPAGHNIAMRISPSLEAFSVDNLLNGFTRPNNRANAWIASLEDDNPTIHVSWLSRVKLSKIILYFDSDHDHALESSLREHPERVIPFCVQNYRIKSGDGRLLHESVGNHQAINEVVLESAPEIKDLIIELEHPSEDIPASLFQIICCEE